MIRNLLLPALLMVVVTAPAAAQNLTENEARRFVDSLPAVTEFGNSMDESLQKGAFDEEMRPAPGEPFEPYSRGIAFLKSEDQGIYNELGDIVSDHGFSSPEVWASAGDKLFMAYMASQMKNSDMPQNMTPEMIDRMPKSMQEQMKGIMAMMEQAKNVPPEDIAAMESVRDDLESYMNSQGAEFGR